MSENQEHPLANDGSEDLPRMVQNDDGSKTVQLLNPVTIAGTQVDSVTFRKPKGKDMRAMEAESGEFSQVVRLASRITGKPMGLFDAMDIEDFEACIEVTGSWSKKKPLNGLATGQI